MESSVAGIIMNFSPLVASSIIKVSEYADYTRPVVFLHQYCTGNFKSAIWFDFFIPPRILEKGQSTVMVF